MNAKYRLSTLLNSYLALKALYSFDSLHYIFSEDVAFTSLSFSLDCSIILSSCFGRLLDEFFKLFNLFDLLLNLVFKEFIFFLKLDYFKRLLNFLLA